jgi:hypothetical protein
MPGEDVHEEFLYFRELELYGSYDVEKEDCKVKEEGDNIEDEALLCPLLSQVKFHQADGVLKVILNCFE